MPSSCCSGCIPHLRPGDLVLLGLDLVKDPAMLRAAYDDSQGVTAAFNLNLLTRLNRELGMDFDLDEISSLRQLLSAGTRGQKLSGEPS